MSDTRNRDAATSESTIQTRRSLLTKLGIGAVALGGVPVAAAETASEEALAADGEINCYFSFHDKFNAIYNDVINWAHSEVWLSHDAWESDVKVRIGTVGRKSNSWIKDKWTKGPDSGDVLMLAGKWTDDDKNKFVQGANKGRINTERCADPDAAYKYWFHEVGHAHGLEDDEWDRRLMDPKDWYAMAMKGYECSEWNDTYPD